MTLLAIQWLVSVKVVLSLIETFILTECINTASFFSYPQSSCWWQDEESRR